MRGSLLVFMILMGPAVAMAQWDVPVRIEMNGDDPADRQIIGLADPDAPDAAVSHAAARANTMAYANATGTTVLSADLVPIPASYTPGMAVTIVPATANHANASLDLNGLGPIPIVKWGTVPLDSADLQASVPVRMVYDGEKFLLIGTTYINCPEGFQPVGSKFCISSTSLGSMGYYTAAEYCVDMNARLCTFSEWVQACRHIPGFVGTILEGEWVDHAANDANAAKRVGYGSTGFGDGNPDDVPSCIHGTSTQPTISGGTRCCRNR